MLMKISFDDALDAILILEKSGTVHLSDFGISPIITETTPSVNGTLTIRNVAALPADYLRYTTRRCGDTDNPIKYWCSTCSLGICEKCAAMCEEEGHYYGS